MDEKLGVSMTTQTTQASRVPAVQGNDSGQEPVLDNLLDKEWLTVTEAAPLFEVSQSTLWRWIDRGELLAYRFGHRRVRHPKEDVAQVITPVRQLEQGATMRAAGREQLLSPLTAEERRHALAALADAEQHQQELLARRGGKRFAPSWEVLDELRDERTRHLW